MSDRTYRMIYECENCLEDHVASVRFGQKAPARVKGKCAHCGCDLVKPHSLNAFIGDSLCHHTVKGILG